MNSLTIIVCSLLYLGLLFGIAFWAERRERTLVARQKQSLLNNPYIYALSLAVYCTAWTFYGSVGQAATQGINFLSVYIGPTLAAPLWWIVLRKIIRICKVHRITSIADFISARYGKNRGLGILVTVICVAGIIPYISIQLKATAVSFALLSGQSSATHKPSFLTDQAFYMTLLLGAFTILFGTRKLEATERHEGLVTAIAFESLVKLIAFLAVGLYVTFGLFNGPGDIFGRASQQPALQASLTFGPGHSSADWFWYTLLSIPAILFLPRQFQVAVVENVEERHLNKAMWLFPLYLFLITLFVLPVAFGGKLWFGNTGLDADGYVLSLPLLTGQKGLALLAYIGGLSAATSMIIVETTALSVMISNNVVMPWLVSRPAWQLKLGNQSSRFVMYTRRLAILVLLLISYGYYRDVSDRFSLVSVGMISFAAVAQFSPAIIGGICWKNGAQAGARLGLIVGTAIWFYTLIVPTLVPILLPESLLTDGPFGLSFLKPQALFGLTSLTPIAHSVFWSLFFNVGCYVWGSINRPQTALDHNQAILFVDVFQFNRPSENTAIWKGKVSVDALRKLLITFFGPEQSQKTLERFARRNRLMDRQSYADPGLVTFTEKMLAGAIGTASARILVSSIAKEDPITVDEIIRILKTSQELMTVNKELERKSNELQQLTRQLSETNERLKQMDQQKDEFLSTITHEIRTPITSIRALTEILHDNDDVDTATRQQFLGTVIKESERLTRLINQVLDLERFESGRMRLHLEPLLLRDVIKDAVEATGQLASEKYVDVQFLADCPPTPVVADRDRLMQVLINLLSNAIKFCEPEKGRIIVRLVVEGTTCNVSVCDNGAGIDPALHELIFEKFYQVQGDHRKPKGSGLGLAITKKIIELHNGSIDVDSQPGHGSVFTFQLPLSTG